MFPSTTTPDDDNEHDSDEDLEQEDLNEMVTGTKLDQTSTKDPLTNAFYKRIQDRKVPEQCLRYTMEWRRRYDRADGDQKDESTTTSTQNDNPQQDDDDSQPLWIRSTHQPTEIPPCPYCQAPRAFEFQLMPQMLHFLHANRRQNTTQNQSEQAKKNETAKQALIAAQSIIANSDPSQIPPSFVDAKAKAMQALEQDLEQHGSNRVDWGVVAIYTCTASCSSDDGNNNATDKKNDGGPAYREEFVWLQPALDV
eukprot:Sro1227_g254300.2  (253) ;mRNA; r:14921-15679